MNPVIKDNMFQGKAILILGPRQVGKTTLVKMLVNQAEKSFVWFDGDEADVRTLFTDMTSTRLQAIIGSKEIVVIDEAQRIENVGLIVKLLVDHFPHIQVLVTGSSALELSESIHEPLTGRKYQYSLFPLSFEECANHTSFIEERRLLEHRLLYGYYPDIVNNQGQERELLSLLTESYLYKDIFMLENIKKPPVLEKVLQALALQVSNEVKYHELANLVGADTATVERYIDLLEKMFVIIRLPSLNRNMRNEIKKGKKVYFYDTGIRNAIIKNFTSLSMRQDSGALWENFCIIERLKRNQGKHLYTNQYFWRTHTQQEIDYIEEYDGMMHGFEFKWNPKKRARVPVSFTKAYPGSKVVTITPENFDTFIY